MSNLLITNFGKLISTLFKASNLGDGSTWPGHIALKLNRHFIRQNLEASKLKTIIIAGTNGKTTTASIIHTALEKNGRKVFQNKSGANLLNGIASSLIINSGMDGKLDYDFAIFEIDENALPQILTELNPTYLILLNLFRDQLDRYGEVNIVSSNWNESIKNLTDKTTIILNADDPQIAQIGKNSNAKSYYFGVGNLKNKNKTIQHAADSSYCPNCSHKLIYREITFSHLGNWYCAHCKLQRPKLALHNSLLYPLPGMYNIYNTHAAVLTLKKIGLTDNEIKKSLMNFTPAFGRQEAVEYKGKKVQIFLSKNPTSFNQSFQTIADLGAKSILFVLNDRIPDGRDISWIWDAELFGIDNFKNIFVAGDRLYDMGLRIKYEMKQNNFQKKVHIFEGLNDAINNAVDSLSSNETLYILPTYSGMLEARKILTGKKIL